ncbi:MAG: ZIP family metal transporter [Nitrososphaerota archaeon]|nr:ZIP family metal transporter [Candidatus Bathyarchaeota archaeon]MDW8194071.1 ZIP family metal transporter [Nitrososphaerota archaeon]
MDTIYLGFTASLIAGLATGVGAFPIFFKSKFSDDTLDVMLGFAAGVMLAAAVFSLLVPAVELGGTWVTIISLIMGAVLVHSIDQLVPHLHPVAGPEGPPSRLSRLWLFIIAMSIHNFPEGLAVGISSGDMAAISAVAGAIGLQNAPEGLAVALPLLREKCSKGKSIGYATLTGLVEPIGGLIGAILVSLSHSILPWGLAFAAGAMLFVIIDEMIPESHKKGFGRKATFGLIGGFSIMMLLNSLFK